MKKGILFFLLACLAMPAFSQEFKPVFKEQSPSVALAISPIPFTYNTAEINLDLRLKERQWLTIAPRLQYGTPSSGTYDLDPKDVIKNGIGLGLVYRYFPLTRSSRSYSDGFGPFVSAGLRGQTTRYQYEANSYVPYTDDYGVDGYYINGTKPYDQRVSQLSADFCIGYSLRLMDILFAEAYVGLGTRFSDYEYNSATGFNLGKNEWDTGYTGYTFTGGIRFGIFLDKYTR
ncbi:MAG: hypothetical protein Q8914_05805 [Bacteroidota bacterium]|nr:hypothetical protein [Bacteroidota bacterium]